MVFSGSASLPQEGGRVVGRIDDGTFDGNDGVGLNDDIEDLSEVVMEFAGMLEEFSGFVSCGGRENGLSEGFEDGLDERESGDSYPDRLSIFAEESWDFSGGWQEYCVGAWEESFHESELCLVHDGERSDRGEVGAHECERSTFELSRIAACLVASFPQLGEFGDGASFLGVTNQGPCGVCRHQQYSSFLQFECGILDEVSTRVPWVELDGAYGHQALGSLIVGFLGRSL